MAMAPVLKEFANEVVHECRGLFKRLPAKLRSIDAFNAPELFELYKGHETLFSPMSKRRKREKTLDDFNPAMLATWHFLLFAQNDPPIKPDKPAARLKLILEQFKITDLPKPPSEPADNPKWVSWLKDVVDRLDSSDVSSVQDLAFVGGCEEAVKEFRVTCRGATAVYNTVFVRSREDSGSVLKMVEDLENIKKRLIDTGNCVWHDIVLENELPDFLALREKLTDKQRKRSRYRVLPPDLPFFQCLVYKCCQTRGAAFVGWKFPGCSRLRVYNTDDYDTVEYFFEYMHHLFWSVARDGA